MEDLQGIPRSQTILDELPNLGSSKANYYQNMSVVRRNLREGVTFKDASFLDRIRNPHLYYHNGRQERLDKRFMEQKET